MSSNHEQGQKVSINWFPGHMTKAKRAMEEKLKVVDMVIEIRDARVDVYKRQDISSFLNWSEDFFCE